MPQVQIVEAAVAVIVDPSGSEVVISLRKGETHLGGFWEFPGGKVEAGETPAQCAVREAQEEVGLIVEIVKALGEIVFAYREKTIKLYPFLCKADRTEIFPHTSEEAKWAAITSLGEYRFPPANDAMIAELLADQSGSASALA